MYKLLKAGWFRLKKDTIFFLIHVFKYFNSNIYINKI